MVAIGPLVLLLVIVVVVYAARHASETHEGRDAWAEWVGAGLLTAEQAGAIAAYEAARRAPARPEDRVGGAGRVPAVAEALGYLGGVLATVGLGLVVSRYWDDVAVGGRLALSGGAAVALAAAGVVVRDDADAALARLRAVVWLASTAAAGLFAGVLAADGFRADAPETIVAAVAGAVVVESGALWAWRERPVQQLTFLAGVLVLAGALVAHVAGAGPVGLTVWVLAATLYGAGWRRRTPLPLLTEAVGAAGVAVGGLIVASDWPAFGLPFAVVTASALLAVAAVPSVPSDPSDRRIGAVAGGLALVQVLPPTLGYFAHDAGVLTGVAAWIVGAVLLRLGVRAVLRAPVLVQIAGGLALIGGAALTGVQWHGFAPAFGLATGLALVAAGMPPGRFLLSLFGTVGLLVNVPWAIARFFPGGGRAPLLVFVSGVLLLAFAVLLARRGGGDRRTPGPPRAAPGPA